MRRRINYTYYLHRLSVQHCFDAYIKASIGRVLMTVGLWLLTDLVLKLFDAQRNSTLAFMLV